MTFAHFSDTHLGYRAYGRTTAQGYDQREADVMITFRKCLAAMLERDPDVVVHAGDLFHVVRPSNHTIVHAFRALSEFQEKRGGRPFVLIGGNHDSPRTSDSGNILQLFQTIPGLSVATGMAERFEFDELNLDVLCVPSNSLVHGQNAEYLPSGKHRNSLLVLHGLARQAMPEGEFDIEETHSERWTYVALGDYHVNASYARNCCYAGSTDFTSTNIWEELVKPKGWVWYDTEIAHPEFVTVETRRVIDLDKIDARNLDGEGIGEALLENGKWNETEQPIVRQQVLNVHPETRTRIPQPIVRELGQRALSYRLDVRLLSSMPASLSERTPGESLEASWTAHSAEAVIPFGMDRERITDLGRSLMREVIERETAPAEA